MSDLTARQQEIIEVAMRLIAEQGMQKLTMSNIAKQIGISEPAIYRHFQNKQEILLVMLAQFKRRSEFHLKQAQFFESSGILLLETFFLEYVRQFALHPSLAAVLFSEEAFRSDPLLNEEMTSVVTVAYDTIVEVVGRSQKKRELRHDLPEEHLALVIMGALRLLVKRWYLSKYTFDLEEESGRVWESLKRLLEEEERKGRK